MKPYSQKKPKKTEIQKLRDLHQQEDFLALEEASRALLDKFPNYPPEIQNFLGAALAGQGLYEASLDCFFKAVVDTETSLNRARFLNNIGVSYIKLDDQENALHYLTKALQEDSENISALFNKGNAMRNLGLIEESLKVYKEAFTLDPKHFNSIMFYSLALKVQGKFEGSKEYCQRALSLKPQSGQAHRHLSSMINYSKELGNLKIMEGLVEGEDLVSEDRMNLCFALSKAYEDLGRYKDTFEYLLEGNSLARKGVEFSTKRSNNYFRLMKETFSKEFCNSVEKDMSLGRGIIFVLGMPRSGTSLIEQILSSHSKVFGAGELRHFRKSIDSLYFEKEGKKFPKNFNSHPVTLVSELGRYYEEMISDLRGSSPFFVDKMPYNYMYIPLIKLSLPSAKIVLIERDPIDNCLSIFKQKFGIGNAYAYSLVELGNYYNSYRDIVKEWKSLFPNEVFSLNYEELTRSQKDVTSKLLDFCGLDWEENCMHFHKTDRNNKTASSVQVRQPLYTSTVKLWEKYRNELEPLINILNK